MYFHNFPNNILCSTLVSHNAWLIAQGKGSIGPSRVEKTFKMLLFWICKLFYGGLVQFKKGTTRESMVLFLAFEWTFGLGNVTVDKLVSFR